MLILHHAHKIMHVQEDKVIIVSIQKELQIALQFNLAYTVAINFDF